MDSYFQDILLNNNKKRKSIKEQLQYATDITTTSFKKKQRKAQIPNLQDQLPRWWSGTRQKKGSDPYLRPPFNTVLSFITTYYNNGGGK